MVVQLHPSPYFFMELPEDETEKIIVDNHDDWELQDKIIYGETNKGSTECSGVYKHKPSGKYYEFVWSDCEHSDPFEYRCEKGKYTPIEMKPRIVTARIWVAC